MSKKKIAVTVFAFIAAAFLLLNIVWFVFMQVRYKPLMDVVECNAYGQYTLTYSDNYKYSVFKPSYLSFTGNLSISKDPRFSDERDISTRCSLIIWPLLEGGYEIGASVSVYNLDETAGSGQISFDTYGFVLDENQEPVKELKESEKELLNKYSDEISLMYKSSRYVGNRWLNELHKDN